MLRLIPLIATILAFLFAAFGLGAAIVLDILVRYGG